MASGREATVADDDAIETTGKVIDLMAALKESLAKTTKWCEHCDRVLFIGPDGAWYVTPSRSLQEQFGPHDCGGDRG